MAVWASSLPQILSAAARENRAAGVGVTQKRYMPGAPEIYLQKRIDNSRVTVKSDPVRRREMTFFSVAVCLLMVLMFAYVAQHFRAIQYGYDIEAVRSQRDQLADVNKTLKLEEASLRDPERIDSIARSLGMQMPVAGQVQRMEVTVDSQGPVMARAAGVSVISLSE